MRELEEQWVKRADDLDALWRAGATGAVPPGTVWSKPIAGNVIPLAGSVKDQGYTSEEWKLVSETRKILHDDSIVVSPTCVRVPVFIGHALSANLEFHRPVDKAEAVALLGDAPGVTLVDGGDGHPTPLDGAGIDPVLVGRVREDPSLPGAINLWVTGDNIRKGAALNGVEMAEYLLSRH
jgi:aspartate-semialdehyde dehydrogenase